MPQNREGKNPVTERTVSDLYTGVMSHVYTGTCATLDVWVRDAKCHHWKANAECVLAHRASQLKRCRDKADPRFSVSHSECRSSLILVSAE